MSIFANKDKTFDIALYWKVTDGTKVTILAKPEPRSLEDPKAMEGVETATVKFRYPSYADERSMTRNATAPDQNGIPVLNLLTMQNIMLYTLIKAWDVKNEKGEVLPINDVTVGGLHPTIARELVGLLYSEMNSAGLLLGF